MAERTSHGERKAANAAEIDVSSRGRAVETGVRTVQIGDERTRTGTVRTGDEAAAVHLAAVLEVTHELGEAVEVERPAVGVHEILLAGAVDGVAETEFDGTARDIGGAAVVLAVVKQQGSRAHLGEV